MNAARPISSSAGGNASALVALEHEKNAARPIERTVSGNANERRAPCQAAKLPSIAVGRSPVSASMSGRESSDQSPCGANQTFLRTMPPSCAASASIPISISPLRSDPRSASTVHAAGAGAAKAATTSAMAAGAISFLWFMSAIPLCSATRPRNGAPRSGRRKEAEPCRAAL